MFSAKGPSFYGKNIPRGFNKTPGTSLFSDILFLILLVAVCLFSIPYHPGIGLDDAAAYTKYAWALVQSHHIPIDVSNASHRIGVYGPYALWIWLFGFSKYLTVLTLIEFLAMLLLIYLCLRSFNQKVALLTCALLGFSPAILPYATVIMGDIITTFTANAPVLIYFWFRTQHKRGMQKLPVTWGILAGGFAAWSFLSKESIIFLLPLFLALAWKDRNDVRLKAFWRYMFGVFFTAVAITMAFYTVTTGNPLYRFSIVQSGQEEAALLSSDFLNRLTFRPFQMFIENYDAGIVILFSLLQIVRKNLSGEEKFFRFYMLAVLGMWWFAPMNLHHWKFLPPTFRLWLPAMVPLAINAALAVRSIIEGNPDKPVAKRFFIVIAGFIFGTYALLYLSNRANDGISPRFLYTGLEYTFISGFLLTVIFWRNYWVPGKQQ